MEILLPEGTIEPSSVDGIASSFHASYEREYTYRLDAAIEVVGVHLVAVAEIGKLEPARLPVTGRSLERRRREAATSTRDRGTSTTPTSTTATSSSPG